VLIPGPPRRLLRICQRCASRHRFVGGVRCLQCIIFLISLSLNQRVLRFIRLAMEFPRSCSPRCLSKLLHARCVHSISFDLDSSYASSAFSSSCTCRPVSYLCILPRGAIKVTKSQLGGAHQRGLFRSVLLKGASATHSQLCLAVHHFVIHCSIDYNVARLASQPRPLASLPCCPVRARLQILFPNFPIRHVLDIIPQELLPRHFGRRCH